jgi:hypothetical protein
MQNTYDLLRTAATSARERIATLAGSGAPAEGRMAAIASEATFAEAMVAALRARLNECKAAAR